MRHPRQVGDHRLAADVLAERQRQPALVLFVGRRIQQLAQIDRLGLEVGQFDADDAAPRHHRDAHRDGAHRAGDVVGKADHPRRLDPRRRLELVKGDDRAGAYLDDLAAHAVILEHRLQQARVLGQRLLVDRLGLADRRLRQEVDRRQDRLAVEVEDGLPLVLGALAGDERARAGHDEADEPACRRFGSGRCRRSAPRRPGAVRGVRRAAHRRATRPHAAAAGSTAAAGPGRAPARVSPPPARGATRASSRTGAGRARPQPRSPAPRRGQAGSPRARRRCRDRANRPRKAR